VTTIAGSRPLKGCGHALGLASFKYGQGVSRPTRLVKISGQKPAGLVRKQRINTRHEIAARTACALAAQMLFDDAVGDRDEGLMRAFPAFDLRLAIYPLNPLVGACGRIARLGGLSIFPPDREYVSAACEQTPK
jgi:hypothetical protein